MRQPSVILSKGKVVRNLVGKRCQRNNLGLSAYYDKRFVLEDGIHKRLLS